MVMDVKHGGRRKVARPRRAGGHTVDGVAGRILTVNVGSSSVKTAIFAGAADLAKIADVDVSRIGSARPELTVTADGETGAARPIEARDHT